MCEVLKNIYIKISPNKQKSASKFQGLNAVYLKFFIFDNYNFFYLIGFSHGYEVLLWTWIENDGVSPHLFFFETITPLLSFTFPKDNVHLFIYFCYDWQSLDKNIFIFLKKKF